MILQSSCTYCFGPENFSTAEECLQAPVQKDGGAEVSALVQAMSQSEALLHALS